MWFKYHQGGRLHNFSEQPLPVLSHPHSKKAFSDPQRDPPVFQFVLIAARPLTGHH